MNSLNRTECEMNEEEEKEELVEKKMQKNE